MTPAIETGRLTLRSPDERDLERIVDLIGDYDVSSMLSRVPHPYTQDDGRAWLARSAEPEEHGERVFAIDDGSGLVGAVSFRELHKTPVIGYWLGRRYWGRGYMSEAVSAALDWLFRETDHDTVVGEAMNENPASLKVQEKLGFTVVGESCCESRARGEARPATRMELKRVNFNKRTA